MVIRESRLFTRLIVGLLGDDDLRALQNHLVANPEAGDLIKSTAGLRKVRWAGSGRGKSGGVRVIYYWYVSTDRLYMLDVYAKNERSDLSDKQIKALKKLVAED